MSTSTDIQLAVQAVQQLERLESTMEEFLRGHLSQCVLSAIYSLGSTSTAELNVVHNYTEWANLVPPNRPGRQTFLRIDQQQPLDTFISQIEQLGSHDFAKDVLHNLKPTGPLFGILNSECCLLFAKVLVQYGVQYFQDLSNVVGVPVFEKEVRKINGLRSGKGLAYFYMMAGQEQYIKVDRHVERFLAETVGHKMSNKAAQELVVAVAAQIGLTPREVDNMIWASRTGGERRI
jgi:hypothetical protein